MLPNAAKVPFTNLKTKRLRWLIREEKIELSLPERGDIKLVNITGDHGIKPRKISETH
jgi:hypothetical protein